MFRRSVRWPWVLRVEVPQRFLQALVVILIALFASKATAATLAVAPMCDPSAASVPAPIPALPNQTGTLAARGSCDEAQLLWQKAAPPSRDNTHKPLSWERPERALPSSLSWSPPKGARRPVSSVMPAGSRPGHSTGVYRPPR